MGNDLIFSLLTFGVGAYFLTIWIRGYRARTLEIKSNEFQLPGTSKASRNWIVFASVGAAAIVLLTTLLEMKLGVFEHQTSIHFSFILAMLGASVAEEVIFRGYLIVSNKGRVILVCSALFFSLLFAIAHPYLWTNIHETPSLLQHITGIRLELTPRTILSSLSIFSLSCWFYYTRFSQRNPNRSLLPCFFAHATANLTVYLIKLISGFVTW